jgi:3-oxoacyl-[acyl-carrier-protein] synthase-3
MKKAYIQIVETFVPKATLNNHDLSNEFGLSEAEILKQTGIKTRFHSADGQLASDLAVSVGEKLFQENPDIKKTDINFLLFCTSALDYVGPATACLIHEQLGLSKSCLGIDVPMGCAGFTNGLILAKALIENGTAESILFITSDMPTKVVHPGDYYLRSIFSDAAAATLITNKQGFEIGEFSYGTDGSGANNLIIKGSGARNPVDKDWLEKYDSVGGLKIGRMEMNGMEILKFSLRELPPLFNEVLAKNNLTKSDIDHYIFHQASGIVIKYVTKKLDIDESKVISSLEEYGNTVSASVPIALSVAIKQNLIRPNSTIFIAGFGIGYSWSASIIKN